MTAVRLSSSLLAARVRLARVALRILRQRAFGSLRRASRGGRTGLLGKAQRRWAMN